VRIGIANDLPMAAELLRRLISRSPSHQIAWIARDGAEAVAWCERDLPELVLMDLIMPVMDGAEATRRIMSRTPCPILIVTATLGGNSAKVFEALGAGAVDAVKTPALNSSKISEQALLLKIERIGRLTSGLEPSATSPARETSQTPDKLVVIGASAGGPGALVEVFSALPQNFSAAVVVVQHIDEQFAQGLAEWLNERSKLPVCLAREGDLLISQKILIAGAGDHLIFKNPRQVGYTTEPVENSYRPSVDVFFHSAAQSFRGKITAVLLTGMGCDGARGLKVLRDAGHYTIAQDRYTSAVYGMPKAAAAINAATEILPLQKIGPRLTELFVSKSK
jgi:two-component system, chemotaxis family, response regulator WspF